MQKHEKKWIAVPHGLLISIKSWMIKSPYLIIFVIKHITVKMQSLLAGSELDLELWKGQQAHNGGNWRFLYNLVMLIQYPILESADIDGHLCQRRLLLSCTTSS